MSRMMRRLRDWFIEKEEVESAEIVIPDWDIEMLSEYANDLRNTPEPDSTAPLFSQNRNPTTTAD